MRGRLAGWAGSVGRLAIAAAAGGWVATAVGARHAPGTVEAKAIYIVDDNDELRAVFGVSGDSVVLSFRDAKGRTVALLGATDDGGTLSIVGRDKSRAGVSVGKDGTPRFEVSGRDGRELYRAPD